MSQTFELWDTETGNVIGEFPTIEAALAVAEALLSAFGSDYAEALVLQQRAANGSAGTVASGRDLLRLIAERAERRAQVATGT